MTRRDGNPNTFTIGELIADAARNSKTGRALQDAVDDYRGRRVNPNSEEYREIVEAMESMPGGVTPSRGRRMTWLERRAIDKILKDGKPKRGKKG